MSALTVRNAATLLCSLLAFVAGAAAQGPGAERFDAPPPAELSPAVRQSLAPNAIRVYIPGGTACEIWLRHLVPARTNPSTGLGILYGQLEEGTLLGVVRILERTTDYRAQRVQPGVYTLRYGLHPVDGNHLGIAPQRDFLVLGSVEEDKSPDRVATDVMFAYSRKVSGTNHPAVWSLRPSEHGIHDDLPALSHDDEHGLWIAHIRVTFAASGSPTSPTVVAVVVRGQAPEA